MPESGICLRITPRARQDLKAIWTYTVKRWGEPQADLYLQQLDAGIRSLIDFQDIGESCGHIRAGYRRLQVNRHLIFYRRVEMQIEIVRVLHQSMDVAQWPLMAGATQCPTSSPRMRSRSSQTATSPGIPSAKLTT
jgi:toxin ParE1/3/4